MKLIGGKGGYGQSYRASTGLGGIGGNGTVTVGNISTGTFVKQEIQENSQQ